MSSATASSAPAHPTRSPRSQRARAVATILVVFNVLAWAASLSAQTLVPEELAQEPSEPNPLNSLVVRAFGSVLWNATDRPATPNSFTLGQLDFFATSNLSERVSVLAEIVLEGSINTQVETDLERLQLTYRFNDYLNISAGRYHASIGFYNAAFHHGGFFETPIGRPRVFAFEDEGGVLPIHEVGIKVSGLIPKTRSSLRYLVEVGNGRSWNRSGAEPTAASPERDQNGSKAINLGVSFRPDRLRGFEAGASYYLDTVTGTMDPEVKHRIGAIYLTYRTPSVEVMAEWLTLTEHTTVTPRNSAAYVQVSRAWGKWRPFYRYDRLSLDSRTLLFGATESTTAQIAGLRVDLSEWVGLKAQYERATLGSRRGVDSLGTQLVFVF